MVWALIGEGIAYPRLKTHRDWPIVIDAIGLTEKGRRWIAPVDAHPLDDGYTGRLRASGVAAAIIARIEDAAECMRHGLLRAAVVMTGLAFEEAVEQCLDECVQRGWVQKVPQKAVARVQELQRAIARIGDTEQRHRATLALVAAETVRTERNQASHPSTEFDDVLLVESLLIETSIHVPRLLTAFAVPSASGPATP